MVIEVGDDQKAPTEIARASTTPVDLSFIPIPDPILRNQTNSNHRPAYQALHLATRTSGQKRRCNDNKTAKNEQGNLSVEYEGVLQQRTNEQNKLIEK